MQPAGVPAAATALDRYLRQRKALCQETPVSTRRSIVADGVAAANKGLNAAYRIGTDSARAGVGHAAHCCTSPLYISCGASARVAMEILGHSGIAITMN